MADFRILENGTDFRSLEDASGLRLLEDGPRVAGGQIAFPGGYGYGSGGYGGGGTGAGGGGLAGGGQGGAGSGGGGGTGTTTTVLLPFKPGLILFIMSNQTLAGWRTLLDGTMRWTCTGMASWGAADKTSIFNCAHATHYTSTPYIGDFYGSGQYDGYCIWIRETINSTVSEVTALAHVSAINDNGFDLTWDAVAGAGYPIYFVAARDQKAWGDFTNTGTVTIDSLTGGTQDNRPQGGFAFFHGYNGFPNGTPTSNYLASSVSTWARPDKGDNFDPMALPNAYKDNMYEQAFTYGGSPPGDAKTDSFIDLPINLFGMTMSPWLIGTILQGMSSLVLSNGQASVSFNSNNPQGFTWATGSKDSCDARYITPAVSGDATHELAYDFVNESVFKADMGFTYSRPLSDMSTSIGHSVGIWARQVENDPTQDFHATVALGRDMVSGRTVGYHGLGYSWMGQFSLANPGIAPAGRLEYQQPGEIVTHTDVSESNGREFMLWMNGVPVGGWIPQIYRLVMPT